LHVSKPPPPYSPPRHTALLAAGVPAVPFRGDRTAAVFMDTVTAVPQALRDRRHTPVALPPSNRSEGSGLSPSLATLRRGVRPQAPGTLPPCAPAALPTAVPRGPSLSPQPHPVAVVGSPPPVARRCPRSSATGGDGSGVARARGAPVPRPGGSLPPSRWWLEGGGGCRRGYGGGAVPTPRPPPPPATGTRPDGHVPLATTPVRRARAALGPARPGAPSTTVPTGTAAGGGSGARSDPVGHAGSPTEPPRLVSKGQDPEAGTGSGTHPSPPIPPKPSQRCLQGMDEDIDLGPESTPPGRVGTGGDGMAPRPRARGAGPVPPPPPAAPRRPRPRGSPWTASPPVDAPPGAPGPTSLRGEGGRRRIYSLHPSA